MMPTCWLSLTSSNERISIRDFLVLLGEGCNQRRQARRLRLPLLRARTRFLSGLRLGELESFVDYSHDMHGRTSTFIEKKDTRIRNIYIAVI
mmetsp:Transcript_37290/g.81747  ORF Transcript_37290/g.81747 Transcript_37290/m.81747 type:complete len:92 (+) Transcript_37290:606-881(+)